jgi:hypothetical protein
MIGNQVDEHRPGTSGLRGGGRRSGSRAARRRAAGRLARSPNPPGPPGTARRRECRRTGWRIASGRRRSTAARRQTPPDRCTTHPGSVGSRLPTPGRARRTRRRGGSGRGSSGHGGGTRLHGSLIASSARNPRTDGTGTRPARETLAAPPAAHPRSRRPAGRGAGRSSDSRAVLQRGRRAGGGLLAVASQAGGPSA